MDSQHCLGEKKEWPTSCLRSGYQWCLPQRWFFTANDRTHDWFHTIHEASFFMDYTVWYNQIQMAPEDQEATAFCTPNGIFCYKVIPFEMKNAGATYQRAIQTIFQDLLHKTMECYFNDLVVKSKKRCHTPNLKYVRHLLGLSRWSP